MGASAIFRIELPDYDADLDTWGGIQNAYADALEAVLVRGMRGHIGGLTLSTPGGSGAFNVAPGSATSATANQLLQLGGGGLTKNTNAWAVGHNQGGLDTGAIANNTWYHVFLIRRDDTGIADIIFSTNLNIPLLPANYTQYRRIGAVATTAAGQWVAFQQAGDRFYWRTPIISALNAGPVSGIQNSVAVMTPLGISTVAILRASATYASGGATTLNIYPTFLSGIPAVPILYSAVAGNTVAQDFHCYTNSLQQVAVLLTYSGAATYNLEVHGWIDRRGQDD